jgi:hypothetical protein
VSDEVARRLLLWAEDLGASDGLEVIALDFRRGDGVHAVVFSGQALIPELVAMAFNGECAQEIAIVIDDDGKPFDFSSAASNHDVAKLLSRATKRSVVYVDAPQNIARHSMLRLGLPAALVEGLLEAPAENGKRYL